MTYNLYWGDLHCHCGISYGYGSLERALRLAREHLDFCSVTGHAFWPDMETLSLLPDGRTFETRLTASARRASRKRLRLPTDRERYGHIIDFHQRGFARLEERWADVLRTTARYHEPGRFVPFLSYEWHSFEFGDHNVYFPGDQAELVTGENLDELTHAVGPFGALVIPHHIGYGPGYRGINWEEFNEGRSPVVEVFSGHGCSESDGAPYPMYHVMGPRCYEGTAAYGLGLGKRFGFIAGTDHHAGYPGHYRHGRTAIYAEQLTREALWNALGARRCYAVTGDRIELGFHVNDARMGEEVTDAGRRVIRFSVSASDVIDKVEVIRNGRPFWRSLGPLPPQELPDPVRAKVRIEYGWGDRERIVSWEGRAALSAGRLLSAEPCFGGAPILAPKGDMGGRDLPEEEERLTNAVTEQDERSVRWVGYTRGNPAPMLPTTNALILEVEMPRSGKVALEVNGQHYSYTLADLLAGSRREFLRGWHYEAILVHRAVPEVQYTMAVRLEDEPERETDYYYLRVAQENGQWAWSSPIWVSR